MCSFRRNEVIFQRVLYVTCSYEQAFLTSTYLRDGGFYWTDLQEKNWEFSFSNGDRPPYTNWAVDEPGWSKFHVCVAISQLKVLR